MGFLVSFHIVSWESSSRILFVLQRRLFKASYVLDKMKCLELQKLILHSTCARLLAIRETTQLSPGKKIPGIDGKTSLTFLERFELSEYLRDNCTNWNPQVLKILKYVKGKEFVGNLKVPSISDRVWLCLVRFIVEPTHKAFFHPNNFSSLIEHSVFEIQNLLFLSLSLESCNSQRRFLRFEISGDLFSSFNTGFLVETICAPRSIKLGLFRFLKKGLPLSFFEHIPLTSNMGLLLSNIYLSGIETIHPFLFRYDNFIICLLRPLDDEKEIVEKINTFFSDRGLNSNFFFELRDSVVKVLFFGKN